MPLLRMTYEHTQRELLAALLALHEAEAAGFDWTLETIYRLGPPQSKEEVVVTPFFYDDSDYEMFLRRHPLVGYPLVNLMYEQLHIEAARDYFVPSPGFAREQVVHCAWGDRTRQLLVDNGVPAEHVRLTGQPRFDIYHRPELLVDRATMAARYGLEPSKRWILVPYNFNAAYMDDQRVAELAARGFRMPPGFRESSAEARDVFTPMVRRLSDEHPDTEFILRMHPSGVEAESLYAGESRERSNLHVIAELDIANWITQAELVIVWTSSSGLEGMVAETPVISLEPQPYSDTFDYDVQRILPTTSSPSDVEDLVRGDGAHPEGNWNLFDEWFCHRGGETAKRLASVFSDVAANQEFAVTDLPPRPLAKRARGRLNDVAERWPTSAHGLLNSAGWSPAPANLDVNESALRSAVAGPSSEPLLEVLW